MKPTDFQEAVSWVGQHSEAGVEAAMLAEYKGLSLGHMAHQSWRNFWRSIRPRTMLGDEPSYFSFMVSVKILIDVWERAIEELQPDLVFTLNGLYPRQRIPCEMVKAKGGRYITYDVMGPAFHLHHNEGAPHLRQDEAWEMAKPTQEELDKALQFLQDEMESPGKSFGEDYLLGQKHIKDWDWIKGEYGIDDRPMLAWFANVAYDSGVVGFPNGYPDLPDVIEATIDWFDARPKYQLVLQMHPNERNDPAMTLKGETLTSYLAYKYPVLPDNVHVIPASSNASPHVIAEHAMAACTWTSSLTWQLAYNQVPTIVTGWAACSKHVGFKADTKEKYLGLLKDAMLGNLRAKPEWKQRVLEYKAIVEGRCWVNLSHLIGDGYVNDFVPQWDGGWPALVKGKDPVLDMVVDCIENGEPFFWPR
jgi:hypothetical protein